MPFKIGDYVAGESLGVGKIVDTAVLGAGGVEMEYYVVEDKKTRSRSYIPKEKAEDQLRSLPSKSMVVKAFEILKSSDALDPDDEGPRYKVLQTLIEEGDFLTGVKVVHSLMLQKQDARLSRGESTLLKRQREQIIREMSTVLEKPEEEINEEFEACFAAVAG